jgi:hypothetical protein
LAILSVAGSGTSTRAYLRTYAYSTRKPREREQAMEAK